jgi:hypothetical protein
MTNPIDIDSNDVILSVAEELLGSPGQPAVSPVWYAREPNTIADVGGDPTLAPRSPLGTRKRQSGSIVGIDAKAGWNEDFTSNNFARLLQGIFCADVSGEISTLGFNSVAIPITSVSTSDSSYNAGSGLAVILASMLALASGFTNAANNGVRKIVTSAAGKLTTNSTLVDEASPPATAKLEVIGYQGAASDITINVAGTIGSTILDFTTLPLAVGQWIFIGGDNTLNKFATAIDQGYARLSAIAAHTLTFDKSTFGFVTDTGSGKKIQLFWGRYFRDPAANKVRTYQIERKLGNDGNGVQTEYVVGAFPNEWTLTLPKKEKLSADIAFIGIDYAQQTGATGAKTGVRTAVLGESALNSSSDVYRSVIGPSSTNLSINPTAYFSYITDGSFKISNNAAIDEAVGSSVGFDINVGEFDAVAQVNAYFSVIALQQAIRNHSTAAMDVIIARNNVGWLIDIPLAELSGGINKVEKNKPVMAPVTVTGLVNSNSYVAHVQHFQFLPAAAMPMINQGFATVLTASA